MAQAAIKLVDDAMEPAAADAASAIDRAHLARMTFGDRSLERELLELFDRQAVILLRRMRAADTASVADSVVVLAHTLKGSALGVGADGVARAAAAVEEAGTGAERDAAIERLAVGIAAARACIATVLPTL